MTVGAALRQGTQLLEEARTGAARLTAEVLLSHALNRDRVYLYAHSDEELSERAWIHYGRYLHERINGKPTQYITKQQEFYGRPFRVSPSVLIPRPETEHVVETVLRLASKAHHVLDVGCGSGAIAVTLALEMPAAHVSGTDISAAALLVAAENAARHQAAVHLLQCDLSAAIASHSMDVLACNPPYVPEQDRANLQVEVRDFEPGIALYGGPTGVEIYQRLIPEAARVLKPGGWLIVELGYRLLPGVRALLGSGWGNVEDVADLAGIPRVLAAQYQP
ncbi:MAG TPA: peptide chain release factor N(5)-glutamine methyltransferase [Bryobacteraceae bacterium]|nr:peptide chain release factor N(5)-glutamine methyltransferase [Bryobacteraceae bacterium]